MKKKLLIIFFVIFIVICFLQMINFGWILGLFPPSKNDVEKAYYINKPELMSICTFLQKNQYADIRIELFDSAKTIICYKDNNQGGYDKEIFELNDKKIINDLEKLKNHGFIRILKEYDYISFQVWGSFGESVSLMFSQSKEPNVSEINAKNKVVEEIKPEDWFYYSEKFE